MALMNFFGMIFVPTILKFQNLPSLRAKKIQNKEKINRNKMKTSAANKLIKSTELTEKSIIVQDLWENCQTALAL